MSDLGHRYAKAIAEAENTRMDVVSAQVFSQCFHPGKPQPISVSARRDPSKAMLRLIKQAEQASSDFKSMLDQHVEAGICTCSTCSIVRQAEAQMAQARLSLANQRPQSMPVPKLGRLNEWLANSKRWAIQWVSALSSR